MASIKSTTTITLKQRFINVLSPILESATEEQVSEISQLLENEVKDMQKDMQKESPKKTAVTVKKPTTTTREVYRNEAHVDLNESMVTPIADQTATPGSKSVVLRSKIIADAAIAWGHTQTFGSLLAAVKEYEPERMKVTGLIWLLLDNESRGIVCSYV
jgi:hypothetical protein